jgi:hypothetical protein
MKIYCADAGQAELRFYFAPRSLSRIWRRLPNKHSIVVRTRFFFLGAIFMP